LRKLELIPDFTKWAEGAVLCAFGDTRVLCTASLEERVPPWMKDQKAGWLTAEYAMLPRATVTRSPREVVKGRQSGRTHEIQRLIGRSLRAVVDLDVLGERSVMIDCDVIQADGGTRTASITGAYVALAVAVGHLVQFGTLKKSPLVDAVAATSVGVVNGTAMLDLDYQEDSRADVDMNVVMTGSGKFIEVQATAEHKPFDDEQLAQLVHLARRGIVELIDLQKRATGQK